MFQMKYISRKSVTRAVCALAAISLSVVAWHGPRPAPTGAYQTAFMLPSPDEMITATRGSSGESIIAANRIPRPEAMIPLIDMGEATYYGFEGGLYPNAGNEMPGRHREAGLARAAQVQPLDVHGDPDPSGKYLMMSIGMSNTTQEFCSKSSEPPCTEWSFMGQAAADPEVDHADLVIINGAHKGQTANDWESPQNPNYDRVRETWLTPLGLSEQQMQVVWIKVVNPRPTQSLPSRNADAYELERRLGNIVRALKVRYPNIKQVFLSSRVYGGYAETKVNPEPYAYETAFAVKWLIEAQIEQMNGGPVDEHAGNLDYDSAAPWLAWGAYMWAAGTSPRSDGLIWKRSDFQSDGIHPSYGAEKQVGSLLLTFFKSSPYSRGWFLKSGIGDPTPIGRPEAPQVDDVLLENYPDPFGATTTFRYSLPQQAHVRLVLFDAAGRRVALLIDRRQPAGLHESAFDAARLPSGIYFSRLEAGDVVRVDRVTVVR